MAKDKEVEVRNESRSVGAFDLIPEFERMAERFFGDRFGSLVGDWPTLSNNGMTDIRETEDGYVLCAEVPGIPMDDINVSVSGNLLTVRAEYNEESGREGENYRRQYRRFNQSFSLPSNVDADKVEAHCENGLLEVWIPKTEATPSKKIELQSGRGGFLNRLRGKVTGQNKTDSNPKH